MKKILTFCAAVLASVSMWAATVDDLKVISANYNVYFEDVVTSSVSAGTLITDYVLSQVANTYKNNQGTDKTVEKLYCLRVKGTSQDVLAFKVSSSCTLVLYANRATDRTPYLDTKVAAQGESSITGTPTATDGTKGYVTYSIPAAGTYYIIGNGSDCYLAGLEFSGFCTDPEFTVLPTEGTGFVGDPIDITISSKNQSRPINPVVTVDGVPGVSGTDYTFSVSTGLVQATPLKAGTFVITFSQASNGTYCAAEESATFVISEKTPVASVTVDGPAAAYVGAELTYTATAANAANYEWYVDGVAANNNLKTFVYTAVKGNHVIYCEARNQFNKDGETETWIKSNEINLAVTNVSGTLISHTIETGSGNIDKDFTESVGTGNVIGGSGHQKTQKNGKLGSEGHYISLTLASGSFLEGDTVKVVVTPEYSDKNKTYSAPTQLKISTAVDNSNLIGESDTKVIDPASKDDLYFDIILSKGASTIYLARDGSICKQNPIVKSISVVRPVAVKSTSEAFKSVSLNGKALDANFDENHAMTVEGSYVDAPVVVFTKTVTTIYEDNSQTSKDVEVNVTAEEVAGAWQAQATINSVTYTIKAAKAASVVVTYKDGETVLGTENVAANGNPANYAQYQNKSLASFAGWYNNADLADEHAVADMSAEVISKATTYYAKFENKYATSVNIEKLILDNSKGYDVVANALNGTNGYASNYNSEGMDITNDSLNNSKGAMRNYAYLGLKIKSKSLLNFRVAQGQTVLIKFGNVATTPQVSINGGEYAAMTITEGVYSYTATGDDLLSMYVSEANKAVVLKQIVIGEAPALEDVVYDINCGEVQNGTLSCNWAIALPGETVALTVTPAEGYKVEAVTVNSEAIEAVEGAYSFIMPAAAAAVSATFVKDTASALGNTEAEAKAVKVVRDGQLLILKNGVLYNAQGAIVK